MTEEEIKQALETLSRRLEQVYLSVEKTRKYFLVIIVVSVIAFVLPLIGLVFAIPSFLSTYTSLLET